MTYYVWARKPANSYKYGFSLKIEDNEFQNLMAAQYRLVGRTQHLQCFQLQVHHQH